MILPQRAFQKQPFHKKKRPPELPNTSSRPYRCPQSARCVALPAEDSSQMSQGAPTTTGAQGEGFLLTDIWNEFEAKLSGNA